MPPELEAILHSLEDILSESEFGNDIKLRHSNTFNFFSSVISNSVIHQIPNSKYISAIYIVKNLRINHCQQ